MFKELVLTKILAKINKEDIVDNNPPSRTTASSDNCKPIAIRKTPKMNTKNNFVILFMISTTRITNHDQFQKKIFHYL